MGKKGGGNNEAAIARAEEQQRQAKIREGTGQIDTIFGQNFSDKFYGGRRKSYLDYATPQVEDQYGKAREELTFALARGGNLDSSVRAQKEGDLQKLYDQRKREISDQGVAYESDARNSVEDARADLIRTLSATGDADAAAKNAVNRSVALSKPPAYSPLAGLFADFTATLGTQAAMERAEAMSGGAYKARFNTGLFGTPRNAVAVSQ